MPARSGGSIPAALRPMMSSRAAAATVGGLSVLGALAILAPAALAGPIAPEGGGSPNADGIRRLYWITFALGVIVFIGVQGFLLYCILKFRARRGAVAAQIHGNTRLEIGWTVGAALIVVMLSVITLVQLPDIRNPAESGPNGLVNSPSGAQYAQADMPSPPQGEALNIEVNGRQYVWRFEYPEQGGQAPVFSYETMYVPVDTTVTLDIRSEDVQHSWWIPKLGGKMDALPGYTNKTWFKISEPGTYVGQCAELCGRGHANMLARVVALPVPEYEAKIEELRGDIEEANERAQEQRERLEQDQAQQ
jgi:cytochrome c oxidase subunit II